jgi:hypothetical protein
MQNNSVYNDMSKAEFMASQFLKQLNLYWLYEQAVYLLDDKGRPRVWTPDFYIPDLGLYIEIVGDGENPQYSWREMIYRNNHIPIIFVAPYQIEDWQGYLVDRINQMHRNRWEIIKRL